jgi:ribosomal protein S27AE
MSQLSGTPSFAVIERPNCPKCGAHTVLARIEPDKPGYDRRTFDCRACDHVETIVVRYRLEA